MEPPLKKRRLQVGEVEQLPTHRLEATLDSAIASQGSVELAIIYLFNRYNFDFNALKAKLKGLQFGSML